MDATQKVKTTLSALILFAIACLALVAGFAWSNRADAAQNQGKNDTASDGSTKKKSPKIVYPTKTELDFEGAQIEGELRNPGEFYFQHRHEEKFDSLVKPRTQFHREMLRDAMLSK